MKTRLLIIIGILMMATIPFVTFAVLDRYSDYGEHVGAMEEKEDKSAKLGDKYYIEPERKEKLEAVELDLRDRITQLHQQKSLSSFGVNLDHRTQEIIVIVEKDHFNAEIEKMISEYPDDIRIVFFNDGIYLDEWSESEPGIMKKARDLGINNIMDAVDSEELSFDEKKEYIQIRYEEDGPVTTPSLNIRIKDFTRNLDYGERPTFTVIETGYAIPCTHPTLEVYYLKQETGNEHTLDDLVYEDRIMYSCPFFDSFYPVLKFWDETDFEPFPVCEKEGRYLVVGDSGYERMPLEEYYCGMENQNITISKWDFSEEQSYVIIPLGAVIHGSASLIPEEITVVLGKNNTITWINDDDTVHTLVSDKGGNERWSTGMMRPGESSSVTFNNTGIFNYHGTPGPWITGTVTVLEK
ncbi:cupredoxin domain-containing protein [Nitrosopumilus adriaticus]|uniref:Uncharacterized protein n=1 Tax=Nitrosopumilus adriaticus TaxID=1580092 RepID=A0A0D5C0P4_9ARCH|nr:hypothetical protein [Nitrosopumilus adriaticus]AJW70286.1 exported protein of unknown function [Nitrosopumilus adriaticus]